MTTATWTLVTGIIIAWGIANAVCWYWIGHCHGWLKCSDEHTKPALEGWRKSDETLGAAIEEFRAFTDKWDTVTNPTVPTGDDA